MIQEKGVITGDVSVAGSMLFSRFVYSRMYNTEAKQPQKPRMFYFGIGVFISDAYFITALLPWVCLGLKAHHLACYALFQVFH